MPLYYSKKKNAVIVILKEVYVFAQNEIVLNFIFLLILTIF